MFRNYIVLNNQYIITRLLMPLGISAGATARAVQILPPPGCGRSSCHWEWPFPSALVTSLPHGYRHGCQPFSLPIPGYIILPYSIN